MTKTTNKTLTAIFTALQTMQPKDTWCPKVTASEMGPWRVPTQKILKHQSLQPSNQGSGYDVMMVVRQFGLLSLSDLVFLIIVTVAMRKISMYNETRWLKLIPR